MSTSLKVLQTQAEPAADSALPMPFRFNNDETRQSLIPMVTVLRLFDHKLETEDAEKGLREYFLVGFLALLVHIYIVQGFQDVSSHQEVITPVKVPPMVQITLVPPKPPEPVVQPPPPPPPPPPKKLEPIKKAEPPPKKDVVALKPKPPKPKPLPKPVERVVPREEPRTEPSHVAEEAPPAPVVHAPPAPPVEKVTPPSASAGYLHNPAPEYPSIAEDEGWSGRVVLKVHVLANGRPDNVMVAKSSGHEVLDQAAVRTVRSSWHFAPAMRGDTPTDGWVSVPIVFNNPG